MIVKKKQIKRKITPTQFMKKKSIPKIVEDFYNYIGNFPFQPEMIEYEVITNKYQLSALAQKMKGVDEFAYDTETNTLKVLGNNKDFRLVGISISWGQYNNYYIPCGHLRDEDLNNQCDLDDVVYYLKPIFENPDVTIVGTNLKFDLHVLARVGIYVNTRNLFDVMLASWLCNENTPNGLKENSHEKMGVDQTHFKEVTDSIPNDVKKRFGYKANQKVHDFGLVTIEDGHMYALYDAFYTWCLALGFRKELEDEKMDKIYYKVNIPFLITLYKMEELGVTVDIERLEQMGEDMQHDLDDLQYRIYELAGVEFNITSSQQKAELLFGWEKPPSKTGKDTRNHHLLEVSFEFKPTSVTKSGNPSTDSDAIWRISQMSYKNNKRKQQGVEMCKLMLEYSKLSKLKTAFVDGILEQMYEDGKVHPSFNQIGTDSGRISCSKPNLQQLPKANDDDKYQIRSVFIGSIDEVTGKRNKIIALDYHNLEMVCLTYFSHDKNLSEMFANDDDAHGSTAVNMFNLDCTPVEAKKKYPHLRQAAKTINFLLMYGGGAKLLYENLKSDHYSPLDLGAKEYLETYHCKNGVQVAQAFIDKYFDSYSGVAKFIRDQKKFAHRNKCVYTILGRKRRLPDINSPDMGVSSYCERLSVNSAIQGTAGDITISAQNRVDLDERLKELRCNMMIQVHDELVFECPEEHLEEAIPIIKYYMEHPFGDSEDRKVPYLRADYDTGDSYQDAK